MVYGFNFDYLSTAKRLAGKSISDLAYLGFEWNVQSYQFVICSLLWNWWSGSGKHIWPIKSPFLTDSRGFSSGTGPKEEPTALGLPGTMATQNEKQICIFFSHLLSAHCILLVSNHVFVDQLVLSIGSVVMEPVDPLGCRVVTWKLAFLTIVPYSDVYTDCTTLKKKGVPVDSCYMCLMLVFSNRLTCCCFKTCWNCLPTHRADNTTRIPCYVFSHAQQIWR